MLRPRVAQVDPVMAWRMWPDFAWKHQLRIVNWPAELKDVFPGGGFVIDKITVKEKDEEKKKAKSDA